MTFRDLGNSAIVIRPALSSSGDPVPNDFCEQLERVIADARTGKVTSIAWIAIGPEFTTWRNAFTRGRSDRINLIGQMAILQSEMIDREKES